jgi:poly(A) polymerase
MRPATLKRFVRLPRFEEHMELHRLDCTSSNRRLQSYNFIGRMLAETPPEQIRPAKLLTGNDLSEMGYKPGPVFSQILASLEDAQLEGKIATQSEARRYVSSKFRPKITEKTEGGAPGTDRRSRIPSGTVAK